MYYIGIDLGGTNAAAGVVNEQGEIIAKASNPTNVEGGTNAIISSMAKSATEAMASAGLTISDIAGVGIGSPGAISPAKGIVDRAANLGFINTPVCELLAKELGITNVRIENDANVAALAEANFGAAKGIKDSVTITLGTGVGGGIVINGKIYSGFDGKGAELGHMVIHKGGEQCSCGRRGCWEAYASVTALIRITKAYMEKDKASKMWELVDSIDNVSGRTAFDAMRLGDATAKEVVNEYLYNVANGIVSIINILQPQVLCIGGGISKEGETLLGPVREFVKAECFTNATELRIAQLGNDAGILGAAMLCID